jgi:Leucine-rich repeat (LRR) protein
MAFKNANGTVSIQRVKSWTATALDSSISYTFWPCASASSSAKSGLLTYFDCCYNSLTSLDVSTNTALTGLYCYNNSLTSLDVSKNTTLTYLYCDSNALTSLDVSTNTALTAFGANTTR